MQRYMCVDFVVHLNRMLFASLAWNAEVMGLVPSCLLSHDMCEYINLEFVKHHTHHKSCSNLHQDTQTRLSDNILSGHGISSKIDGGFLALSGSSCLPIPMRSAISVRD